MIPPKLPTIADLREQLKKLEANPGSIVLIALESFETRNDCRVTTSWLSAEERKPEQPVGRRDRETHRESRDGEKVPGYHIAVRPFPRRCAASDAYRGRST